MVTATLKMTGAALPVALLFVVDIGVLPALSALSVGTTC